MIQLLLLQNHFTEIENEIEKMFPSIKTPEIIYSSKIKTTHKGTLPTLRRTITFQPTMFLNISPQNHDESQQNRINHQHNHKLTYVEQHFDPATWLSSNINNVKRL